MPTSHHVATWEALLVVRPYGPVSATTHVPVLSTVLSEQPVALLRRAVRLGGP